MVFSEWSPSTQIYRGSRDPARAPPFGMRHPGGVLVWRTKPPGKVIPGILEHSHLRGRYPSPHSFVQREVNDETRSHHNRDCGVLGSDRPGGGGECSIWPSSFSSLWPFSSV